MAIACLWQGRIVSSTAMGQTQVSTPAAAGSASECIPTLHYPLRVIHLDILRMVTSSRLTPLDHPRQTKAMAQTSGEILQTPAARIAPSIRFSKHRSPTWGKFMGSVGLAEHLSFKDLFLRNVVKAHPPLVSQALGAHKELHEVVIHIQGKMLPKKCPLHLPLMLHGKKIRPGYQSS